jgi:hypothetical protein
MVQENKLCPNSTRILACAKIFNATVCFFFYAHIQQQKLNQLAPRLNFNVNKFLLPALMSGLPGGDEMIFDSPPSSCAKVERQRAHNFLFAVDDKLPGPRVRAARSHKQGNEKFARPLRPTIQIQFASHAWRLQIKCPPSSSCGSAHPPVRPLFVSFWLAGETMRGPFKKSV